MIIGASSSGLDAGKQQISNTVNTNVSKRKQSVTSANEEMNDKRPRLNVFDVEYRNLVYQNYIRLFQQHQQQLQQQHLQQPTLMNQTRLREQLTSQMLAYFEANQSAAAKQNIVMYNNSAVRETNNPSPAETVSYNGCSEVDVVNVGPAEATKSGFNNELNQLISNQSIQNWCAKCNTYFRLTSDLVHHMRTYHRKNSRSESVWLKGSTTVDSTVNFVKSQGIYIIYIFVF